MMKTMMFLFLSFVSTMAFAYGGNSLTWQKLALEEKIQRKYVAAISHLLKEGQFLIEIETEINEPTEPNFGNTPSRGIKVSDISLEDSRGDYIAFSKMGLEVPVVDKLLDEEKNRLTNLYRYNETYDLFKNLEGIKITVFLSDKIPGDLLEVVKKVIQNLKITVAEIKPEIKFESLTMEWTAPEKSIAGMSETQKQPEEKEPKIWAKDWLEWASRWGNAVGLILGTLILGVIAFTLFKQWKAFMENLTAKTQNQEEVEEAQDKELNEIQEELQAVTNDQIFNEEDEVASIKGYERFKQCLEQHPEEAINIIRNLINEENETSGLILRGIAQQASSEEMEKLLEGLSEVQRGKWKSFLTKQLEPQEIGVANKELFQEVVKSFLVPSRIKDGELLNLVMDLNVQTTIDFMDKHPHHIGILMNIISPSIINRIFSEVDDGTAEKWLMAGAGFNMRNIEQGVSSLKEQLVSFLEVSGPKPFLQRIAAMILSSSPSREKTLYRALAQNGNPVMVMDVAKKQFPSELILKLPGNFLKECIQSYPMHKRLEFILSQDESTRTMLIDILAEPGTAAREMMDMEIENLIRDVSQLSFIESRQDEIWEEFVKMTRSILHKNTTYTGIAHKMIADWSEKLKPPLKAIQGEKAA